MKNHFYFIHAAFTLLLLFLLLISCPDPDSTTTGEPTPGLTPQPTPAQEETPESTAEPGPPLSEPVNVQAELTENAFSVTWDPVEGATGYEVQRQVGAGEYESLPGGTISDAAFVDRDFPEDEKFRYMIQGYNRHYISPCSSPSPWVSRYIMGLTASCLEYTDRVRITWDEYSRADSYRIYRSSTREGSLEFIGETSANFFEDTGGIPGEPAFYQVTWMEGSREKGEGGPAAFGVYADYRDFYEPNDNIDILAQQEGTSVFTYTQPPLLYSFGDPDGSVCGDVDWYKYQGEPQLISVIITFPPDTPFMTGDILFRFSTGGADGTGHILDVRRENIFCFDSFNGQEGEGEVYFTIFTTASSSKDLLGTYTVQIILGL